MYEIVVVVSADKAVKVDVVSDAVVGIAVIKEDDADGGKVVIIWLVIVVGVSMGGCWL